MGTTTWMIKVKKKFHNNLKYPIWVIGNIFGELNSWLVPFFISLLLFGT